MKALRLFTVHSADLPAFRTQDGKRGLSSAGLCAALPVTMASMKDIRLIQIVIDGRCWEGEIVLTAPSDEPNRCLVVYRHAYPVEGNVDGWPGNGPVVYRELERRGAALTGAARQEAEDRLATLAIREMAPPESSNRGSPETADRADEVSPSRSKRPQQKGPLVIGI